MKQDPEIFFFFFSLFNTDQVESLQSERYYDGNNGTGETRRV